MNFTAFGGGASVVASNDGNGNWKATYTIPAGSIDATNRNVTVTATDNAGNATSTSDTTNATVDNIAPTVSSITPAGGAVSSNTMVDFIVDFSEAVSNVSIDDFTPVVTGSATGTIGSVSASSGDPITVTVGGISGSGTLTLNLKGSTNIVDDAGNSIAAYSSGTTHTVNILTAPDAPTIGAATAGDGQVSVAFTAPVNDGGSAITGYTVTSNPHGITGGGNGFTTSPITVSGLTNGTAYTFKVTATNAIGTSTASAASGSATPMADQTITFANPGAQNFGTSPTLTASSTSGLAVTFSSSTTGVCTITPGGELTFVSAGSCTIDADQVGNASTNAAPTVSQTFTVNAIAPGAPTIGTATASDTQADVSFTAPASTGGATITGYTVTSNPGGFTGTGAGSPIVVTGLTNGQAYTFTVTADNSAGTGPASSASNSVTPKATQTVTFNNPGTQNFGTTPTFTATADSGLSPTFTSSTPGVCTITGVGAVTFVSAGSCTIDADQVGNASTNAAPTVSQTFTVNAIAPGAPTIGTATASDTQADVSFTAPASNGGATITGYTVTSNPGGITASGNGSPIVVTGLTNGQAYTFTVTADNSAGTGPASSASNSVTPKATQTVTFNNPGTQNFGTTPTFTATADSGLSPTFTSSTPGVCTITGVGAVTFVSAGTCTINADQAGNGSYLAATQVTRSFTVNAVVPGAPTIGTATVSGAGQVAVAFTVPASNGGSAITGYTVTSNPGGITASGNGSPITVTGLNPGTSYTFTVTATNGAGTGSASASSNAVSTAATQAITFANPGAQGFGSTPTLVASADSGLPVSFASTTPAICTVGGSGELTFLATGNCTITADQAGNGSYLPAAQVSQTFAVNAVVPGAPVIGSAVVTGNDSVEVSFTAPAFDGGAAITTYTVTSQPDGITATGSGSPITVSGLNPGTSYAFTVVATNSAGGSAPSASSNAVSTAATQTITFANPGAQDFDAPQVLVASADSGLPVRFASSTPGVCTITADGALSFVSAGTCTVTASQEGDASHLPVSVTQSFSVNPVPPAAPVLESATVVGSGAVEVAFAPSASTGGAAVTYVVMAQPGGITASGSGSPITVHGLTDGVSYTFTVSASGAAGDSTPSDTSAPVVPQVVQVVTFDDVGTQRFDQTPVLSARADSGLPVTFRSQTPQVCTVTAGGEVAFVQAGDCTLVAEQVGDATHRPASATRTFAVEPVPPGMPEIQALMPAGSGQVSVSFVPPVFDGGTAITGYLVTATPQVAPAARTMAVRRLAASAPGVVTATGSGSPIVVRGLVDGMGYVFTVAAYNAAGEGEPDSAQDAVVPVPELVANPVQLAVAYGAAATTVALDITGVAEAVDVVDAPAHGTVVVEGLGLRYQPQAGFSGTDVFTYAARDAYQTTAAAQVRVEVAAPVVAIDTAALPDAVGGSAYQQPLAASGGMAPYAFALAGGALPPGLVLSAQGQLSGTPTAAGRFDITVAVTDSSTGNGPFTATRAYTLVVEAPQVALATATLPAALHGQDYAQQLQANGGTAPYRFTLTGGELPAGLSLSGDGLLSGAPTAAGTHRFTVQASDAHGFAGTGELTLEVGQASQSIEDFQSNPATPVYAPGGSFGISARGGGSGQPVVFASASPAVCRVDGTTVAILAAGVCVLTADQAGDANHQPATQRRLEVTITAATPALSWSGDLQKVYGEADFDLPDPRSDSPGAFTFSSRNPEVATVNGRRVSLVGAGSAVLVATQAAAGNYAEGVVELTLVVGARPDPTRDAHVSGSLQAQVDASVHFAQVQGGNIRDRLRQVRSGHNANNFNFALAYAGSQGVPGLTMPVGRVADAAMPALPEGWGMWLAGTATFGKVGRNGSAGGGFDFNTGGITLGADRAVGENVLLGMAGSWGKQGTDFDDTPSKVDADQRSLAVYGLWRVGEHLFVDGLLANGWLDFDLARWSEPANASAQARRKGDQWFGALTFGYEHRNASGMTLTGYGRYDSHRATLDGYRESGLGVYDLSYGRQRVDNSALAVGLEGSLAIKGERLSWRPHWAVEYRSALENRGDVALNYVQRPQDVDYVLAMRSYNDDALALRAGLDLQLDRGWMFSLLLGHEQGRNATRSHSIGLQVRYGQQGARTPMYGENGDEFNVDMTGDGRRCRQAGRCAAQGGMPAGAGNP